MKTRRGPVARRYHLRTRIKPTPPVPSDRVEDALSPAARGFLELLVESMRGEGRDSEAILMSFAEEITPHPDRLAQIRAEMPPSPYSYDDEGEMAY